MFEDNEINSLSPDLIYENGVCVKASDCPCEHHGMLYPSGLVIQEDCNNWSDTKLSYAVVELRSIDACVCVNACIDFCSCLSTCFGGMWNCTENSCPGVYLFN